MKRTCKTCIWGDQCENDWTNKQCEYFSPVDEMEFFAAEVRKFQTRDTDAYYGLLKQDEE